MISILIPVYNQIVVGLVKALQEQCESLDIPFQILVFDDKSDDSYREANMSLHHEFGVNYVELSQNLGRAKIRNRLGRMAQYNNLLFLDGDSKIVRNDFVRQYLAVEDRNFVTYGGRVYQDQKPKNKKHVLHWKYGRTREALSVKDRRIHPYLNFQSNNFMIKSHVFKNFSFDAEVKGYGYEDLLYAEALREAGVSISHIDNPVLHDGLEDSDQFLLKTDNAIKNLVSLNKEDKLTNVRLTQFYGRMKKYGLVGVFKKYWSMKKSNILQSLRNSNNPPMRNFAMYKLNAYVECMK